LGGAVGAAGKGHATLDVPIPDDPALLGTMTLWQGFFPDAGTEHEWSVTNGLVVTVQ